MRETNIICLRESAADCLGRIHTNIDIIIFNVFNASPLLLCRYKRERTRKLTDAAAATTRRPPPVKVRPWNQNAVLGRPRTTYARRILYCSIGQCIRLYIHGDNYFSFPSILHPIIKVHFAYSCSILLCCIPWKGYGTDVCSRLSAHR